MFAKEVFLDNGGADVIVSDGKNECCTFFYPCQIQKGEEIISPLVIFETGTIVKSTASEVSIRHQNFLSKYNYWIIARVVDVDNGEISVGNLRMILNADMLPGDIRTDDIIEFAAERIDL
ncbi:hypothetical protein H6G17_12620 [Chroococcidiopsis sp. FACHB-1243]|uniref:hypothetical protein n=1 Tax=Chroococcidiopsis sp. [FACHB-1243] TaxID=2692781 RepID=UPI00177CC857|nr:hypothetical protein [Chroococcidiopsis sp. [FACHB-1243]]MBD2306354.1 hypothetical protein [Chroococcidiopsis sp. [FACHB-1243]]